MIYFDNAATALKKPPEVAEAAAYAIDNFGNAGRSFCGPSMLAGREIFNTRVEIAKLIGHNEPLDIAFTSSATESFNLVIGGLIEKNDHVITTAAEHNSVLRPLYLSGCDISYINCDDNGKLLTDSAESMIKPSTKLMICSHGSNVTGNIADIEKLYKICKANKIIFVLDISQTFGAVPVNINMADIFCFTGHKSLFGPQGTGGIIIKEKFDFNIVKTGGTGINSFDTLHSSEMPDIFETGTLNGHSIYGLQKGVKFINETGVGKIRQKNTRLLHIFYEGVKNQNHIKIYGDFETQNRLPIISLNIDGLPSSEFAERLWTDYGIATRPGIHCAPLLHKRLGTAETGIVRLSISYFNTEDEIKKGVEAVNEIANSWNI
jgi:cysteine desulfurase family protein